MGSVSGSSNNSPIDALKHYSALHSEKGGKTLLGLDKKGQLVAEKVTTIDFIKAFFGFGKAVKYTQKHQKELVIGTIAQKIGVANLSPDDKKVAITALKTLLRHLETHGQLEAIIKNLEKPEAQPNAEAAKKTRTKTPEKPQAQPKVSAPQAQKPPASQPAPTQSKPKETVKGVANPSALVRIEKQVSQAQIDQARAMSILKQGSTGHEVVDLKSIPDNAKAWLLKTCTNMSYTESELSHFEVNLVRVSSDRMNVEIIDKRRTSDFSPNPTYLLRGNNIEKFLTMLNPKSGSERDHNALLIAAISHILRKK